MGVLVKIGWTALLVVATAALTVGLLKTVYFEPTDTALAAEGSGQVLVVIAAVLLVGLAAFARYALSTPTLVPLAILAATGTCIFVTLTDALALIVLPVAYPLLIVAVVLTALAPTPKNSTRSPRPDS